MSSATLVLRYAAFAAIATAANLIVQALSLSFADPRPSAAAVALAMVLGTAVGLAAKYVLDKAFIFADPVRPPIEEISTFGRYTLTGLVTTAIFWSAETAATLLFATAEATLAGGAAGLIAGYALKYRLDRRLVFKGANP